MRTIQQRAEAAQSARGINPGADVTVYHDSASIPPSPTRWMPRRKAEILAAVRRGTIALSQVCEIHGVTTEEFLSWRRAEALYGLAGLRTTITNRESVSVTQIAEPSFPYSPPPLVIAENLTTRIDACVISGAQSLQPALSRTASKNIRRARRTNAPPRISSEPPCFKKK